MASSDKFIQIMLDLLDKLIENQSKNANLLTEIKGSLHELRGESEVILENIREKLPETLLREQEYLLEKLNGLSDKIETNNNRLSNNIDAFSVHYKQLTTSIDENTQILKANASLLNSLQDMVRTKDAEKEKLNSVLENVSNFIDNIRSKRVWIAVMVAAITALATALSSISNAWATFNKTPTAEKNVNE